MTDSIADRIAKKHPAVGLAALVEGRALVFRCPDCGQPEVWSPEEVAPGGHGRCRRGGFPCACDDGDEQAPLAARYGLRLRTLQMACLQGRVASRLVGRGSHGVRLVEATSLHAFLVAHDHIHWRSRLVISAVAEQLSHKVLSLLGSAGASFPHLQPMLQPDEALVVRAVVYDPVPGCPDVLRVIAPAPMPLYDRATQYGVPDLAPAFYAGGHFSPPDASGARWPVPDAPFLHRLQQLQHDRPLAGARTWSPPACLVRQIRSGQLAGCEAFERLATDFTYWLALASLATPDGMPPALEVSL